MKAAVVTSFTAEIEIVERDVTAPAAGAVLIRLEARGLCHTDIPIAETRSLEGVNQAMADVQAGRIPARLVFDYAAIPANV